MKKMRYVLIVCVIILFMGIMLWNNNTYSALQEVTNTNRKQSRQIEELLMQELSFQCRNAEKANIENPVLKGMNNNYEAYSICDNEGREYTLILRTEDKDVACVLDDGNQLVFGLVDSGLLPNYSFEGTKNL